MKKRFLPAVSVLVLLFSVAANAQQVQVLAVSKKVVTALKNKDMKALSQYVHPAKGVRFAPYAYLNETDLIFKKSQVPGLFVLRQTYIWGSHDGSGDPINLPFPEYYKKFIYDRKFAAAPKISYNKQLGAGNTIFNVTKVYPNAKYVEYYFPGTKKYGGMDWRSLILIFEKSGARWFLVSVAHDEWTI